MSPEPSCCIPLTSQRQFALNSRQRITFWRRGRPMQVSTAPAGAAQALCIPVPWLGQDLAGSVGHLLAQWSVHKVQKALWAAQEGGRDVSVWEQLVLALLTHLCAGGCSLAVGIESLHLQIRVLCKQTEGDGYSNQHSRVWSLRGRSCIPAGGLSVWVSAEPWGGMLGGSWFKPQRPLCFFAAAKDGTAGVPNLQLHDLKTGKCLKSFIQKKMQNW